MGTALSPRRNRPLTKPDTLPQLLRCTTGAAVTASVTTPPVLSVVTGQSGVSVSSVCDGVVLASSVVEVVEEMKEELHHGRL